MPRATTTPLCLLALLTLTACGPAPDPRPTRLVLITLDTLRYDSLAGSQPAMPLLKQAAQDGLIFEQFYSSTSSTQPTHASMFTGLHPWQHGVTRNGIVLPPETDTLAERLAAAGYSTHAVVASFPLHRRFGFAQGFDTYEDAFLQVHEDQAVWNDEEVEGGLFFSLAGHVTDRALQLLDEDESEHQFFWFHYFDPHAPYGDTSEDVVTARQLGAAMRGQTDKLPEMLRRARQLYDLDVAALDRSLQRLLTRLDQDTERWETHILITADHGESFGEDGSVGHGKRVTRPQVHVPTVLLSPRVTPGRRQAPAGSADVLATLLSLAGLQPERPGTSHDLTEPTAGTAVGMRRTFAEPTRDLRVTGQMLPIEGSRFFLVRNGLLYAGDEQSVDCEDPAATDAELAAVRRLFGSFQQELDQGPQALELLDSDTQSAMEALGYVR